MKVKLESIIHFFLISSVVGVAFSYSKIYLFHIALVFLVLGILKTKISNSKLKIPKLPTRYHYIFYFMFFWYFLSILWSLNYGYAIVYLFYIICGLSIVLTLIYYIRTIEIQNKVFKLLAIVFIIEIVFSLLEVFTEFRLPISPFSPYVVYFGREMKISENLDVDAIQYLLQAPTGFQWNPNNLAVTFLIILPFFLIHNNKLIRFIGFASVTVIIIMSGSRGVFIALCFMMVFYLFLLDMKKLLISLFILPFGFFVFFSFLKDLKNSETPKIREMANSFEVLKIYMFEEARDSDSIGIRKELIKNGIDALKKTHYIGVGGGGSKAVEEDYGGVAGKITSMHNFWVEMLVDAGVLFTFTFFVWYILVILKLYLIGVSTKHFTLKYYSQSLFLSMVSFVLGAVSASSVIYLFPMWIMYGFAIATINNYKRYKNESHASFRS